LRPLNHNRAERAAIVASINASGGHAADKNAGATVAISSNNRAKTTAEAVDYLLWRLLRVPAAQATRDALVTFLTKELGTDTIDRARTYMEDALRLTVHLIMSTPEYQIA